MNERVYTYKNHTHDVEREFKSGWRPSDANYIAEDAAENYWDYFTGWEDDWPQSFEIFHEGKSLGRFTVNQEPRPEFHAEKEE